MNEKIKELAERYNFPMGNTDPQWHYEDAIYKFAELIVRECEQVSLKHSHRDDDMGAIIARHIKEHFGIGD